MPSLLHRQLDVLYLVAKVLCENGIEYQLSGSFAGKFYGLSRDSHDLDIDIHDSANMQRAETAFKDHIVRPKYRCKDDFFDQEMFECLIDGVTVEICDAENGAFNSHLTHQTLKFYDFWNPIAKPLKDITVNVQDIRQVIGYKQHNLNPEFAANQISDVRELRRILDSGSYENFVITD